MKNIFFISIFGVLGVLSRHFLEIKFGNKGEWFPIGTLTANMLGCFIAGAIFQFFQSRPIDQQLSAILLVGFCGGLTTFSGYALGALNDLSDGNITKSLLYLTLSPMAGVAFALLGLKTVKAIF